MELTSEKTRKEYKYIVGIVGNGMVGSAMAHLFPEALVWDLDPEKSNCLQHQINGCDIVFLCVPTDGTDDGYNYGPIEKTLEWLDVPLIVIKSTVEPGTTDRLREKFNKNIIFNPEFLRENTRFQDVENESRIIIGCHDTNTFKKLRALYMTKYDHDKVLMVKTSPKVAEMDKIVNNTGFADKVTLCNEIESICNIIGIDYEELRQIWLLEPRMTPNHTLVSEEGGFGGYCLPKDLRALIHTAEENGYNPTFLKEIWNSNCRFRNEFRGMEYKDEKEKV